MLGLAQESKGMLAETWVVLCSSSGTDGHLSGR